MRTREQRAASECGRLARGIRGAFHWLPWALGTLAVSVVSVSACSRNEGEDVSSSAQAVWGGRNDVDTLVANVVV